MSIEVIKTNIHHYRMLQQKHQDRLRILQLQQASFGGQYAPPHIIVDINTTIKDIAACEFLIGLGKTEYERIKSNELNALRAMQQVLSNSEAIMQVFWTIGVNTPALSVYTGENATIIMNIWGVSIMNMCNQRIAQLSDEVQRIRNL